MKIETGQTWVRKDPRDGGRKVTVLEADEHFVTVKALRRSRIRTERFPRDYILVEHPEEEIDN